MLYNQKTKCFILTIDTIGEFEEREEALFSDDVISQKYSIKEIHEYIKGYQFQVILDKYKSIAFKTILFQFRTLEPMSVAFAASRNKVERENIYRNAIKSYGTISVNPKGGYSPASEDDEDNADEYSFGLENIYDNDTINLVIENDSKLSEDLLKKIDSKIEPSSITNYKHIARTPLVDEFIRSRKDWSLWIHTQGMDLDLYKRFLTAYADYIEDIFVMTTSDVLDTLIEEFPNISFKKI